MMRHHGDHNQLLDSVEGAPAAVDALIVPTNRTWPYLRTVTELARYLGCPLLVLCSGHADPGKTVRLAEQAGVDAVAIEVNRMQTGLLPPFGTTALLAETSFGSSTDTSMKRNLGLLFATSAGWDRVVFLDDDIKVLDPHDLARAAGLVDSYAGVGLRIGGFPDNSVVCHAYREVGGFQTTFIGGGALAVGARSMTSFFPDAYNEDWFFLLDDNGLRPTAVTGDAEQNPYDPFADVRRARREEFGDCLAEGVYALLDDGKSIYEADEAYWTTFLTWREEMITGIIREAERSLADPRLMVTALKAARGRCQIIPPALCVEYLKALRHDREVWRDFIEQHPARKAGSPEEALVALGLTHAAEVTR